jgi:polar amino acid transport system substrate-binding protein
MRSRLAIAMAVSLCAATGSMAQDASLVEKGALTFGVAATFAPFEFKKDGELTGFDIEMIDLVAKKLGLTSKAMNMEFKGLIPALQGGRLDIINSALYINPQRSEQVDFVPYLKLGNRIVVQKANPAKIMGRDDSLCDKTVAVTLGGISESQARADDKRCKEAGKSGLTVMTLPTAQDSALTLRQGRADAIYESTPGSVKLTTELPDVFTAVGPEFENNSQIGIATRKGDLVTQKLLKSGLQQIAADGSYKALIAKWKLPETVSLFD